MLSLPRGNALQLSQDFDGEEEEEESTCPTQACCFQQMGNHDSSHILTIWDWFAHTSACKVVTIMLSWRSAVTASLGVTTFWVSQVALSHT